MTAIQICALISIITALAILYWVGYKGGLTDGLAAGKEEGKNTERTENAKMIKALEASLDFVRAAHNELISRHKKLVENHKLSPDNHQNLLAIAEKLKLAADTFRAVKSQTQATQALSLRNKALEMATQLEPAEQGNAA